MITLQRCTVQVNLTVFVSILRGQHGKDTGNLLPHCVAGQKTIRKPRHNFSDGKFINWK